MIADFFDTLIEMSLQGTVMIVIILIVRFVLKKLQVNHKYLVGLWLIVFFYLIFPWKISLPIGFWGNISTWEKMQMIQISDNTLQTENQTEIKKNDIETKLDILLQEDIFSDSHAKENGISNILDESTKENNTNKNKKEQNTGIVPDYLAKENSGNKIVESLYIILKNIQLSYIWLLIWMVLMLNLVFSYFRMKKKLLLSIPYEGKIWWAEEIDAPMVFGLLSPKIYLPLSTKKEDLTYIIVHEAMHIRRKDYMMKMFAYMICLLYWFHPLVWLAYHLFSEDMEKACDEAVILNMGEEKKKAYACAMLHFVSNCHTKKRVFAAPVCFNEGSIKSRIQNILKYKPTLHEIEGMVVKLSIVLLILFMTKSEAIHTNTESKQTKNETIDTNTKLEQIQSNMTQEKNEIGAGETVSEDIPTFYTLNLEALQVGERFSLEKYYITNCYTWENHFYIDETGTLWGTGTNEYGQLGMYTNTYESEQKEPVKIAEQVISVDASNYGYFCIYLTKSGDLYGMGINYKELLLGKGSEQPVYSSHEGRLIYDDYQKVTQPVLLMQDVAYARAGGTSIVALKKDKTAYWWGEYNKDRPQSMYVNEPIKVMDNCKYITTGFYNGAAISEDGELYTWGWNILGECGTEIAQDEFVRTPIKVLEDVKMVWIDGIGFNDPYDEESANIRNRISYRYNIFVLTDNGQVLASGMDVGNKERVAEIATELGIAEKYNYSDRFVPVRIVEYEEDR